jgi:phage terminase Nu1 subunit (DNA packaging protein)
VGVVGGRGAAEEAGRTKPTAIYRRRADRREDGDEEKIEETDDAEPVEKERRRAKAQRKMRRIKNRRMPKRLLGRTVGMFVKPILQGRAMP